MMQHDPEARQRVRRTIEHEFVRMEEDFDKTRTHRATLTEKILEAANKVEILDGEGRIKEDTDTALRVVGTAMKILTDVEKANAQAIALKLKNQEQEIASNNASKERIAIILKATAPGRIEEEFPSEALENSLEEMFGADIKEFELKTNPRDIQE